MSAIATAGFRRLAVYRWVDIVIVAGLTALAVVQMAAAVSSQVA
ncbi:hypothetical protein [Alsobacter ponti]|nr:hypothetical protein [Alsobacter ponti]